VLSYEAIVYIPLLLLLGLVAGGLLRVFVRGAEPGGWALWTLLGAASALLAGVAGHALGMYHEGDPGTFVSPIIGIVTVTAIYQGLMTRRRERSRLV
jgi:uncharacterized membrane protein YeaQ/YmgE (transglycosylase-associated protein family)